MTPSKPDPMHADCLSRHQTARANRRYTVSPTRRRRHATLLVCAATLSNDWGFRRARFTRVNNILSLPIGGSCVDRFLWRPYSATWHCVCDNVHRTRTHAVLYSTFSAWSLMILMIKNRKLALQRRALAFQIVPAGHDFVLSSATVDDVIRQIYATVDDPKRFILFNRILIALSNCAISAVSPTWMIFFGLKQNRTRPSWRQVIQYSKDSYGLFQYLASSVRCWDSQKRSGRLAAYWLNCRHNANHFSLAGRNCWTRHRIRDHLGRSRGSVDHSTLVDGTKKE